MGAAGNSMGFPVTRRAQRKLVSHRGITVNGNPVNLPSYQVTAGDAIALSERAQKQLRVKEALTVSSTMDLYPSSVEVDSTTFSGVLTAGTARGALPAHLNSALIAPLYPTSSHGHARSPPT